MCASNQNGLQWTITSAPALSQARRLPDWNVTSSSPPSMNADGVSAKYALPPMVTSPPSCHENPSRGTVG